MEEICTVRIKLSEIVRKLKDVRYVPQLKKNLISVGALETLGLRGTLGESVLKIFSGSLVVLKGIQHSFYYLKSSTVTKNLALLEHLDDNSTRLWHSRLGHAEKTPRGG